MGYPMKYRGKMIRGKFVYGIVSGDKNDSMKIVDVID